MKTITVNGKQLDVVSLIGRGEHSYSFLVRAHHAPQHQYVLKQMYYTPGVLHRVGEHVQSDIRDYRRLSELGIRLPAMLDVDMEEERILKEYIEGPTILELIMEGKMEDTYLEQVRAIDALLTRKHITINYFPSNFVVRDGRLHYVDFQCDDYDEERSFERYGLQYWSKTPQLVDYARTHDVAQSTV